MLKSLSSVSLALLLAATPLVAQETTDQETTDQTAETAEQDAEAPAPNADQLLDLGTPADAALQVGQRYSKEKFGDWDLACVRTQSGEDPCSLLQVLLDDEGGPVAEVSLFRIDQAGGQAVAGATVIAPLETLLPAGLTVSVDAHRASVTTSLSVMRQAALRRSV